MSAASVFELTAFAVCAFIGVAGALGMTTTMSMFRSGVFLLASFIGTAGLFILLAADLLGLLQVMMYIGGMLVMILFMVLFMHDPGGAMMAGMESLAGPERWFSRGLVPDAPGVDGAATDAREHGHQGHERSERHGHEMHGQHDHATQGHKSRGRQDGPEHDEGGHGESGHDDGGHDSGKHDMPAEHHEHGGGMDMSMVTPARPFAAWLAVAVALLLCGLLLLRPAWPLHPAVPVPDSARQIGLLLMDKYMLAFEGAGLLILIGIFGAVLLARPSTHPDNPARAARVAVDEKPEPIEADGVGPAPELGHDVGQCPGQDEAAAPA